MIFCYLLNLWKILVFKFIDVISKSIITCKPVQNAKEQCPQSKPGFPVMCLFDGDDTQEQEYDDFASGAENKVKSNTFQSYFITETE
jgi:hypothetical protein